MKNPNIAQSLRDLMNEEQETKRKVVTAILDYFDSTKIKYDKFETSIILWDYSLYRLNLILDKIIKRVERDIKIILK